MSVITWAKWGSDRKLDRCERVLDTPQRSHVADYDGIGISTAVSITKMPGGLPAAVCRNLRDVVSGR
jgi:hypothetical protein